MSATRPVAGLVTTGLWAGALWGGLEGIILVAGRSHPAIQAAHKVPPAALWVAPLAQMILFVVAAIGLAGLTSVRPRWRPDNRAAFALWSGLGAFAALIGPGVLHWAAVAMIGVGAGVTAFRLLGGNDGRRADHLGRHAWAPIAGLLVVALGTTAATAWVERRREASTPRGAGTTDPDVIFLILDTVRRDRFQADSTPVPTAPLTPRLRQRLGNGTVFSDAWAASSWSLPSHATIMTGRLPQHHRADWPAFKLADSVPTLAEFFRARGYQTGAFSSNHAWVTSEYLGRGFNRFRTYRFTDTWRRTSGGRAVGRVLKIWGWRGDGPTKPMEQTSDEFLTFAAAHPDQPIFGYLCYMDVNRAFYDQQLQHPIWTAKPTIREGIAAYDTALTRIDVELDRLLAALERRGRLNNSIIVVTSDHGESFGAAEGDHDPKGHGTSLYPEQVRVPLFVFAPGRLAGHPIVTHPVSQVDLASFIVKLAVGADARFPGRDLLVRSGEAADRPLFASLDYADFSARSVVVDSALYIMNRGKPAAGEFLFDLATDPRGRADRAAGRDLTGFRDVVRRFDPAAAATGPSGR